MSMSWLNEKDLFSTDVLIYMWKNMEKGTMVVPFSMLLKINSSTS